MSWRSKGGNLIATPVEKWERWQSRGSEWGRNRKEKWRNGKTSKSSSATKFEDSSFWKKILQSFQLILANKVCSASLAQEGQERASWFISSKILAKWWKSSLSWLQPQRARQTDLRTHDPPSFSSFSKPGLSVRIWDQQVGRTPGDFSDDRRWNANDVR